MSRIRSIKPEFWTSEQVMECSPMARLCFIGMWNFCDDNGVHPASAKTLRAQIFPSDDISAHQVLGFVTELIAQGLIREFTAEGKTWWHVTGWHHQKIDRPSKAKYPCPPCTCDEKSSQTDIGHSTSPRRALDEPSRRRGGEGSTEEKKSPYGDGPLAVASGTPSSTAPNESDPAPPTARGEPARPAAPPADAKVIRIPAAKPPCPYEAIRDLYHEILPELRMCRILTETRKGYLRQRWIQSPGPDLEKWRVYFSYVRESAFLMGKKSGTVDRQPFEADLEWLTRPNNFAKVVDGKYHGERIARHG